MKTYILLIFLIVSLGMFAQNISKGDFQESEWFVNTKGNYLFKSDTLTISKITTLIPKSYKYMSSFVKMNYHKTNIITNLDFSKTDIDINEIDTGFCGFNFSNQINWSLNPKAQQLSFFKDETLLETYRVISTSTDVTQWNNHSKDTPIQLNADIFTLTLVKLKK